MILSREPNTVLKVAALLVFTYPFAAVFSEDIPVARAIYGVASVTSSIAFIILLTIGSRVSVFTAMLFATIPLLTAFTLQTSVGDADKLLKFIMGFVVFGLGQSILLTNSYVRALLPWLFLWAGTFLLLIFVVSPSEYQLQRITFNDTNPIWMARSLGFGAIGCVFVWLLGCKRPYIPLSVAGFLLAAIAMTGSRAPLLGTLLAASFGVLLLSKERMVVRLAYIILAILIAYSFDLAFEFSSGYRGFNAQASTLARVDLTRYSIDVISTTPGGLGIGNFRYLWFVYPHNIFLEFFSEWGWLFGFFVIALMAVGAYGLFFYSDDVFLKALFISEIVNASISGNIISPRFLYALSFFGVYCVTANYRYKGRRSESSGEGRKILKEDSPA